MITANYGGNTLTVLTNNGKGVYGSNATYSVGVNPLSVIAVDINGSGKPALIFTHELSRAEHDLSILTNNGSGVYFGSEIPRSSASTGVSDMRPIRWWRRTFFGNGRPALVCADYYSHTLYILTNNGTGKFRFECHAQCRPHRDVGCGGGFERRRERWILIAAENYGTMRSLFSPTTRAGIFSSNFASYAIPFYAVHVVAVDLNNDGKPDLITADLLDSTLCVLTNATHFPAPTSTPTPVIKRSATGARVSWPSVSAGWSLQQNASLTTKTWLPGGFGGYAIADDGTNKSLTLPFPRGNCFFRMVHP